MNDTHNGLNDGEHQQPKDNKFQPVFDYTSITKSDLKNEAERLIDKCNEAENIFPIEVLPPVFFEFVDGCNKALNFPIDYTATAIISAVSTAIGKSAILKVKSGWFEYCSIFAGIIGNSGATKSHPLEKAYHPFKRIDKTNIDRFAEEIEAYNALVSLQKKDKVTVPLPQKPKLTKVVLSDFTPEILSQRLADNERGCAIVVDELATFFEGMNNYSKGDTTSIYLTFWSNKGTSIDRVKNPIPLWVDTPFLNMFGSLQPRVLPKLFPSGKTDNGYLQRFLWAFPDGVEKLPINDNELPERLMENYTEWVSNYLMASIIQSDIETGDPKPKIYYWSDEAKTFFYNWQKANTDKVNENSASLEGEIITKYDNHFTRLSLILQIMENYNTNQISLKAVEGAAKLCSYFMRNSMKVLEILESSDPACLLPENKQALYNALPDEFTTAEANTIGQPAGFNKKAVQRLLNDKTLFRKLAHGSYSKILKK